MRQKGTAREWERLRNVAANRFEAGKPASEIAPLLGVAAQTVRARRRAYRTGGRGALAGRKPTGRPPKLTAARKQLLAEWLVKTPAEWGFVGRCPWTQQLIAEVSVLGALRPATGHVGLLCDFHPDSYVRGEQAAAFLHRVLAEYPAGAVDVVWDNPQAHKSPIVKEVLAEHPRLTLHALPPYAPDLNAQEGVWCLAKCHRMANHTIGELEELHRQAQKHLGEVAADQSLLRSCFQGAGLAISLASAQ